MSQSHWIKGGTTDEAFQAQSFQWERGASVGADFGLFKLFRSCTRNTRFTSQTSDMINPIYSIILRFPLLMEKQALFLFYLHNVRRFFPFFIFLSAHLVSVCHPQTSDLSVFIVWLLDCFLLSAFMAVFTSPFLICHFFPSISVSLSLSLSLSLVLCQPVCFILRHYIPSLCFSFCFPFYLYDSPPGSPSRSILVVYFLSLKPWRWIIEQTDLWLHSWCLGVRLCLFSVFISVPSRLLCLSVFLSSPDLSLRVFMALLFLCAEL